MSNNIKEKSWEDFRNTGMLWLVNSTLHVFGWSIVVEIDDNEEIINVFPARVKYRGFSEDTNTLGFIKVSEYLTKNAKELEKEAKE